MKTQRMFLALLTIFFLCSSTSFAGIVFEEVDEMKGLEMKIPGMEKMGKEVKKVFVTPEMRKEVSSNNVKIIRLDKEVIWTYSPQSGYYMEMTFDNMRQMASAFASPQMMEQMGEMAGSMQMSAKRTGKKQVINGFSCEQVIVTTSFGQGEMVMEQWITPDVPDDLAKFNKNFAKKMEKGMKGQKGLKEMGEKMEKKMDMDEQTKKLISEGFVIRTVSDMGGIKSITEVITPKGVMQKTSIPLSEFDLPAGLKKMPMGEGSGFPPMAPPAR